MGAAASRALASGLATGGAPTGAEAMLTDLVHAAMDRSGLDPEGLAKDAPIRITRRVEDFGQAVDVPNAQAMGHPDFGMHIAVNPDMLRPGGQLADQLPLLGKTTAAYAVVVTVHEAGHVNAAHRAPALADALEGAAHVRRANEHMPVTEAQRDAAALQEHLADMHAYLGTGAMPDRDAFFAGLDVRLPKDVRMFASVLDRLEPEQHGYALAAPLNRAGRLAVDVFGREATAELWRGGMDRLGDDTHLASFARAVVEAGNSHFAGQPELRAKVGKLWDMVGLDAAARAGAPFVEGPRSGAFPDWGSGGLEDLLGGLRNIRR